MGTFELDINGKTYEVEAPDEGSALRALGLAPGAAPDEPKPDKWDRATFLPLAVNQRNEGALAVPGLIYEPLAAIGRLMSPEGKQTLATDPAGAIPDVMSAASVAVPGSLPRGGLTREAYQAAKKGDDALTAAFGPKAGPTELDARIAKFGAESERDKLLGAAERQGVDIPNYMATESQAAKRVAGGIKDIPLVGEPISKATANVAERLGARTGELADDLSRGATPQSAGTMSRDALADWLKTGSKIEIAHGYDMLDKVVKPDTKVALSNTQKRAAEITIKDIESATLDGQKVVDLVREAIKRPGGMTYSGIKELRTRVGDRLNGDIVEPGTSQKTLRSLYDALTKDLEESVYRSGIGKKGSSGKRALATWKEANRAAAEIYDRKEKIGEILGTAGDAKPQQVFERVLDLASSGRGGDIARLQLARNTMGPAAWSEIGAAAINRMGLDKNGRFSPARFTSDYGSKRYSDAAKVSLFGKEIKAHLDDIAAISQKWEQNQGFGNPSGTARSVSVVAGLASAWAHPMLLVAQIGTGAVLARTLSRPAGSQAAAKWAKAYADRAANPTPARDQIVKQMARTLAAEMARDGAGERDEIANRLATGGSSSDPQTPRDPVF